MQASFQQCVVVVAETIKTPFELDLHANQRISAFSRRMTFFLMTAQQILGHGRYQGSRQKIRSHHREHHRFRQRHEQVPRYSRKEEHGHEDDADGKRGNERRNRNLLSAVQNRVLHFLAQRQVPIDILDFHRRVVDQNTDRQRQPTERHDVDGLAQSAQHDDRSQDRKRDGNPNNHRAAPVAQKKQNHQASEASRNRSFLQHAVNRCTHEDRLISQRLYMQLRRQSRLNLGQQSLDPCNDAEGRGLTCFQYRNQYGALSIDPHDVSLRRKAISHVGHIADVNSCAAHRLNRQLIQFRHGCGTAVGIDGILKRSDFGGPRRKNQVLRANRVHHVQRRQTLGLQRVRIQVDLNLPLLSTIRIRNGASRDRDQAGSNEIYAEVKQLLLRKLFSRKRQLNNGYTGRAVSNDQRRSRPRWQLPKLSLRNRRHLRDRFGNVRVRLKKHFHYSGTVQRLRFDVRNIVHQRRECAFRLEHDAVGHIVGSEAGVSPQNADHRNIDIRKYIGRRVKNDDGTQNQ